MRSGMRVTALVPVLSKYFMILNADKKLIQSVATEMTAALADAGKRFAIAGPGTKI